MDLLHLSRFFNKRSRFFRFHSLLFIRVKIFAPFDTSFLVFGLRLDLSWCCCSFSFLTAAWLIVELNTDLQVWLETKPVKQEVSRTVMHFPLQSKWVFSARSYEIDPFPNLFQIGWSEMNKNSTYWSSILHLKFHHWLRVVKTSRRKK